LLLTDVLREFIFEIQIKNYSIRTQKSYKNSNALERGRAIQGICTSKVAITQLFLLVYLYVIT